MVYPTGAPSRQECNRKEEKGWVPEDVTEHLSLHSVFETSEGR